MCLNLNNKLTPAPPLFKKKRGGKEDLLLFPKRRRFKAPLFWKERGWG
jgi:hypothetical protein